MRAWVHHRLVTQETSGARVRHRAAINLACWRWCSNHSKCLPSRSPGLHIHRRINKTRVHSGVQWRMQTSADSGHVIGVLVCKREMRAEIVATTHLTTIVHQNDTLHKAHHPSTHPRPFTLALVMTRTGYEDIAVSEQCLRHVCSFGPRDIREYTHTHTQIYILVGQRTTTGTITVCIC